MFWGIKDLNRKIGPIGCSVGDSGEVKTSLTFPLPLPSFKKIFIYFVVGRRTPRRHQRLRRQEDRLLSLSIHHVVLESASGPAIEHLYLLNSLAGSILSFLVRVGHRILNMAVRWAL